MCSLGIGCVLVSVRCLQCPPVLCFVLCIGLLFVIDCVLLFVLWLPLLGMVVVLAYYLVYRCTHVMCVGCLRGCIVSTGCAHIVCYWSCIGVFRCLLMCLRCGFQLLFMRACCWLCVRCVLVASVWCVGVRWSLLCVGMCCCGYLVAVYVHWFP